jgi:hypothetical protein
MKALNTYAVNAVMDLLIHTNRKTSTLEIKEALRAFGYWAPQDEVSKMVSDISSENIMKYERRQDTVGSNTFIVYEFNIPAMRSEGFDFAVDYIDPSTLQAATNIAKQLAGQPQNSSIPGAGIAAMQVVIKDPREPEFIFYAEKHTRQFAQDASNSDKWIVYSKDRDSEFQVYDSTLTRDQVRSRYTSIMKCKIQDVRACKAVNF